MTTAPPCRTFTFRAFLTVLALVASLAAVHADSPRLDPAVLRQVKQATVYLQVKLADGRTVQGSGFCTDEPGLVLTNAHVLGMLDPDSRRPLQVDVVLNSGEPDSRTLTGRVLGVDRGTDLGVLRIEDRNLPKPLKLGSAQDLVETQEVYIFGFPFGKQLGQNVTVSKSSVSSLRKVNGHLRQVQLNGGMHPGNSGGPVTDDAGQVVGVAVSGIKGTQINFAIPCDYVHTFLNGRFASLTQEQSYRDGDAIKEPVRCELIDPLGRVQKVVVECWTGEPGPARLAEEREPAALPGDSARVRTELTYDQKGLAVGELTLPALANPKQVYYVRPVVTNGAGETRWMGVTPRSTPRPVERRSVRLKYQPELGGRRSVDLFSQGSFKVRDEDGEEHAVGLNLKAGLTEQTAPDAEPKGGIRQHLSYTSFTMGITVNDKPIHGDDDLRKIARYAPAATADVEMDAEGNQTGSHADLARVPADVRPEVSDIADQVLQSLEALSVPLPGDVTTPLQTWKNQRGLAIGVMGVAVPALADMKYTYLGTREIEGKNLAVIGLSGTVRGQRGRGLNVGGNVGGSASVDLETGQVVSADTIVKVDLDLTLKGQAAKAMGTLNVRLKRTASPMPMSDNK